MPKCPSQRSTAAVSKPTAEEGDTTVCILTNKRNARTARRAPVSREDPTDRSTVLVLETAANSPLCLLSDKPIVRRSRPQDFNRELLSLKRLQSKEETAKVPAGRRFCGEEVDKISIQRRWTSTTRWASEESALPTPRYPVPETTLELRTDPVRLRGRRCQPQPFAWQQYGREWDMLQVRRRIDAHGKDGLRLPKILHNTAIVMQRSEPSTGDTTQCTRPTPGYGGFVPRHAVEPRPTSEDQSIAASMCTTSRRTYRHFPPEEYHELPFAHKSPLSKTVTLTYPFNPFK